MTSSIELREVTVRYGSHVALDSVRLDIDAGRVVGLIGLNGSGKSTLFRTIMGLVRPDAGSVVIAGTEPAEARRRGMVAYVPQHEAVDWTFPVSVREVVMMGRYGHQGFTRRATRTDARRVAEALALLQLEELADRQIGQLSGGQQKRAFVARAVAQGARTLLLDEPFAGVDRRSEATIVGRLRELAATGCTVVVSSHDLHGVAQMADEAVLLKRRVLFHGTAEAALQPTNLVRAFGLEPDQHWGSR